MFVVCAYSAQDQQPAEDGGKNRTNWLYLIHNK